MAHLVVDGDLADELTIGGAEGHHLARARRLRPGEAVTAADGRGAWRLYEVDGAGASEVSLRATGGPWREPALSPTLTVAFGLSKGSKPDVVVRGLTELGVDRILPLATHRSVPRWDDRKVSSSVERLGRIAREAVQQSRRARLPEIGALVGIEALAGTPDLVVALPDEPRSGAATVADLPTARPPGVAPDLPPTDAAGWTLVVGPEGGLAPEELALLEAGGAVERLSVGPFVLRTETAVLAAAAVLTSRRVASPA